MDNVYLRAKRSNLSFGIVLVSLGAANIAGLQAAAHIQSNTPPAQVPLAQQTSRYVYDDDGRLLAVIAPSGEVAVYEYDAAGNFTAIRRLGENDLELISFAPRSGVVGTRVIFYGTGFGAGVSTVRFSGGATGTLVGLTNNTITAIVPAGAVTGPITIGTARGQLTTATAFTVQGIALDPETASVLEGESVQFIATIVLPGDEQGIVWSVNGVNGGSDLLGRITDNGFYTAPLNPPANLTVPIEASSLAFPEIVGRATLRVRNLSDFVFALSPGISIGKGDQYALALLSPAVTIGKGNEFASAFSDRLAIGKGNEFAAAFSPSVSWTKGPIITAISPGNVPAQGNTNVTISGANFAGATSVTFFNSDGSLASDITASNINVSGDGRSLTMSLSLTSTTSGRKVVVVKTATAHSILTDVNVNAIQVTP